MKNFIKGILFRTLSILGYRVVRISNENSLESLLARLFRANIDLSVIYDIGAYKGEWATQVNLFLPNSQIFMFEPNSAHNESLVHTQFPFFNVCFSDQIKEVEFYQTFSQGDSYFKEDSEYYKTISPVLLTTDTLDGFTQRFHLSPPKFIKLDTQGSELDILSGGKHNLLDANLVLLECPISKYNEGAPNILEYLEFMSNSGFDPIECTEIHKIKSRLVQIDIAFLKRNLIDQLVL